MNNHTFTHGTRVRDIGKNITGTVVDDVAMRAEYPDMIPVHWGNGDRTVASPSILARVADMPEHGNVVFPLGTTVVLDRETCPFDEVIGTGTVVPMPDSPSLEHYADMNWLAVKWHDQDRHPGTSAPYDPAFLIPVMTHEQWSNQPAPAGIEKFTDTEIRAELDRRREEMRLEAEAAAHAWQVRQMTEWLAKPIGPKVAPDVQLHHLICAIQIVREQVPTYSINKLADEAGIPRSTLKDRLNGNSILTVTDVCKLARAMGVQVTELFQLANKGEIK